MTLKAKATEKIAALRMSAYSRVSIRSQLYCLVLALALIALPAAGMKVEDSPFLTVLATELGPLGTSLQGPPPGLLHLPPLGGAAKLVLGGVSSTPRTNPAGEGRFQKIRIPRRADSAAIDGPHGRSPPSS
jgi:hypothetical protein